MAENLTDTNVGNIEYIRKADAKDALQEKVFHNLTDEFYGAMQVLDELEPADVVQVVHAEWITDKYGNIVCSKCNWLAPQVMSGCLASRHLDYHKSEYCWHCGAKMDEHGEG